MAKRTELLIERVFEPDMECMVKALKIALTLAFEIEEEEQEKVNKSCP